MQRTRRPAKRPPAAPRPPCCGVRLPSPTRRPSCRARSKPRVSATARTSAAYPVAEPARAAARSPRASGPSPKPPVARCGPCPSRRKPATPSRVDPSARADVARRARRGPRPACSRVPRRGPRRATPPPMTSAARAPARQRDLRGRRDVRREHADVGKLDVGRLGGHVKTLDPAVDVRMPRGAGHIDARRERRRLRPARSRRAPPATAWNASRSSSSLDVPGDREGARDPVVALLDDDPRADRRPRDCRGEAPVARSEGRGDGRSSAPRTRTSRGSGSGRRPTSGTTP